MSVHEAITTHVNKQNKRINDFIALDAKREWLIEEAFQLCKGGKEFTTDHINQVTVQINELAVQGIVPSRKLVTREMVQEYVDRKKF